MQPEKSRKKSHVCTMQYVHSNPHTLLLTSHSLACKVRRVVLTLKLPSEPNNIKRLHEVKLQIGLCGWGLKIIFGGKIQIDRNLR